jgi:hypothetical protein
MNYCTQLNGLVPFLCYHDAKKKCQKAYLLIERVGP